MNESLLRNLTPDELVNAFESGQLDGENLKQAFARLCEMLNDAIADLDAMGTLEEHIEELKEELEEANIRAGGLVDTIHASLEMTDIQAIQDKLREAL